MNSNEAFDKIAAQLTDVDYACQRSGCPSPFIPAGQPVLYVANLTPGKAGRMVCKSCYEYYGKHKTTERRDGSGRSSSQLRLGSRAGGSGGTSSFQPHPMTMANPLPLQNANVAAQISAAQRGVRSTPVVLLNEGNRGNSLGSSRPMGPVVQVPGTRGYQCPRGPVAPVARPRSQVGYSDQHAHFQRELQAGQMQARSISSNVPTIDVMSSVYYIKSGTKTGRVLATLTEGTTRVPITLRQNELLSVLCQNMDDKHFIAWSKGLSLFNFDITLRSKDFMPLSDDPTRPGTTILQAIGYSERNGVKKLKPSVEIMLGIKDNDVDFILLHIEDALHREQEHELEDVATEGEDDEDNTASQPGPGKGKLLERIGGFRLDEDLPRQQVETEPNVHFSTPQPEPEPEHNYTPSTPPASQKDHGRVTQQAIQPAATLPTSSAKTQTAAKRKVSDRSPQKDASPPSIRRVFRPHNRATIENALRQQIAPDKSEVDALFNDKHFPVAKVYAARTDTYDELMVLPRIPFDARDNKYGSLTVAVGKTLGTRGAFKTSHIGKIVFSDGSQNIGRLSIYAMGKGGKIVRVDKHREADSLCQELMVMEFAVALHSACYDWMRNEDLIHGPPPIPVPQTSFVSFALVVASADKDKVFLVEKLIDGLFVKFIHNSSGKPAVDGNDARDFEVAVFLCFMQHLQYVLSKEQAYISDYQVICLETYSEKEMHYKLSPLGVSKGKGKGKATVFGTSAPASLQAHHPGSRHLTSPSIHPTSRRGIQPECSSDSLSL
ncbi:hypothetical protein DFH11DRAFT_1541294 [Phellopilus nigrolimitatus]|nr:hypothetical protein DFH11DRAFT_1541294 [Phellopilus nigrolimitatus]